MRRGLAAIAGGVVGMAALIGSCQHLEPAGPADDEVLDGTVEGLTYEQAARHAQGDADFSQVFTPETGLGPVFVATSCRSCHAGDGKGHPFTTLVRFGQPAPGGNQFLDLGGPQLQNRAIPGYMPESIPAGATYARFMPPITTGMGFLESMPDSVILAMADPNDLDGDGISGEPNWISLPAYITPSPGAITQGGWYLGRFGKKASVHNLLQQTVSAYSEDIGIASAYLPTDVYSRRDIDPEVSNAAIHSVVFYLQTLKAPLQRDRNNSDVAAGKQIFSDVQCAGCHRPQLATGRSPIEALSEKTFSPYTDLLLHDMGPGLDDGYTEGSARTSEWRTTPLWGLGLSPKSQGGQYFLLHDGRAHSIEAAILMHGGEAAGAVTRFNQLTPLQRQQLIRFLESL
ncbi:MAG: di-heme oxidoredictase family protein [Bacteroidota bacterium]